MLSLQEIILRLTIAAALGAIIGIERVVRRRPAGVRTSLFLCLATALFTIFSGESALRLGNRSDTQTAYNIVEGIVFLGAGAIFGGWGGVRGMTPAATAKRPPPAAIPMAASTKIVAAVVIPRTPPDPRKMAPAPRKPMPCTILDAILVPLESPNRCASSLERIVNSAVARHTKRLVRTPAGRRRTTRSKPMMAPSAAATVSRKIIS